MEDLIGKHIIRGKTRRKCRIIIKRFVVLMMISGFLTQENKKRWIREGDKLKVEGSKKQ